MLMDANRKLQYQVQEVMEAVGRSYSFGTMIGRSSAFKELIREAGQIAPGKSTVFIRGESGTGKELLARAIHSASARQSQPFIVVNCPSNAYERPTPPRMKMGTENSSPTAIKAVFFYFLSNFLFGTVVS